MDQINVARLTHGEGSPERGMGNKQARRVCSKFGEIAGLVMPVLACLCVYRRRRVRVCVRVRARSQIMDATVIWSPRQAWPN
jgi:hypothetical protein